MAPAGTHMTKTAHLFSELDGHLVDLLESLNADEWTARTVVPRWNVHQVAAHLLDTGLRRLSMCRDGWVLPGPAIGSEQELIDRVNRLNAEGVELYGRLSPPVLVSLTRAMVPQLSQYFLSLDPMADAAVAVSWAGETRSANWFDIAREFTERWHHQQQIRLAVGQPGIMTPRLYPRVIETFLHALPRAYRMVDAPDGTVCRVVVPGDSGGTWHLARRAGAWVLEFDVPVDDAAVAAVTTLPAEIAWRVFTKGIPAHEARSHVTIEGDGRLGAAVLSAVAIVG